MLIFFFEFEGVGKPEELYAFFFCIGDFSLGARHIVAVSSVEALYGFCALTDGGTDAVHGGIAASDDGDIFVLSV